MAVDVQFACWLTSGVYDRCIIRDDSRRVRSPDTSTTVQSGPTHITTLLSVWPVGLSVSQMKPFRTNDIPRKAYNIIDCNKYNNNQQIGPGLYYSDERLTICSLPLSCGSVQPYKWLNSLKNNCFSGYGTEGCPRSGSHWVRRWPTLILKVKSHRQNVSTIAPGKGKKYTSSTGLRLSGSVNRVNTASCMCSKKTKLKMKLLTYFPRY